MKFALFTTLFLFAFNSFAKNSFLVAPGLVEFDLSKPTTQSFIITNDGDEPIRLTIKPIYFDINDPSLGLGEHIDPNVKALEDITKSLRVSPKRLSLKPGQRRDIRVSVRPDKGLEDGDYRTHLLVQMLETAQVIASDAEGGENGVGMDIAVKMETAVAIYGQKGEAAPQLEFACKSDPESGNILIEAVNNTKWRFDGQVVMTDQSSGQASVFDRRVVSLRGSKVAVQSESPYSANGSYQIAYSTFKAPDNVMNAQCNHI